MHVREEEEQKVEFQIAPMVDVVFMLIVFFMLAAVGIAEEREHQMTLPGPGASFVPPIELAIREDGTVLFNELEVGTPDDTGLSQLQTRLQRAVELFGKDQPVIIAPQAKVLHSRVVNVVDICATSGCSAVSFAAAQ